MKYLKAFLIFVIICTFIPFAFGDAVIKEFRIDPGVNKVHLVWKMSVETNVKGYKIKRGFAQNQLVDLDYMEATAGQIAFGDVKEYTYIDKSIFKNEGRNYYYQIVALDPQKKVIISSSVLQVSPQISSVRHTWGSIKAMFR